MKCYFIHDGQQQHGPFSFEELQQRSIKRETPIWKEGLAEWVNAGNLDELSALFISAPPPYVRTTAEEPKAYPTRHTPSVSTTEKIGFRIGRFLGFTGLIVVVVIIGLLVYNNIHDGKGSTAGFSIPYVDPEHQTPSNYLVANGTYRKNFWGDRVIVNGNVTNNASHTNYKDIVVRVTFYSATHTAIETKDYVVYDYVPYGSSKTFQLKIEKPSAMSTCGWDAVGATFY